MKKGILLIVCAIAVFAVFLFAVSFAMNNIGVSPEKLEKDIRCSQKIDDSWTVTGSVYEGMAAYISYPEDKSDHTFSVYLKQSGLSYGYFFRSGGSIGEIDDGIKEFTFEGCNELALISMNTQKVARLEIDDGIEIKAVELDSEKPFAVVLDKNEGEFRFYDADGKAVEYQ